MSERRVTEVADGEAVEVPISVVVAGVEAVALSPRAALVAARELMADATVARVHGYQTASFYVDGALVRSLDGSRLVAALRQEGLGAFSSRDSDR